MINLSKTKVNHWFVVDEVEDYRDKKGRKVRAYNCLCRCGTKAVKTVNSLIRKKGCNKSCGCVDGIKNSYKNYKKEYTAWLGMKSRCYNKNDTDYDLYGGRGIKVCDRWKYSFANFLADIPAVPEGKTYFDKIDNNRNYEPGNVRWVDCSVSAYNRRVMKSNTTGYKGVGWHKKNKKYTAQITVNKKRIYLGSYYNIDDAIKARKDAELKYY